MKVTVRTLDSKSYSFDIENDMITVAEFKKYIVDTVNIPVETQRLIFKGKVLEDSKTLKDYGVEGCVLHLVHKPPPSERRTSPSNRSSAGGSGSSTQSSRRPENNGIPPPGTSVFVGQLPPTNEIGGVTQQIVDSLISQFGAGNVHTNLRQAPRHDGAIEQYLQTSYQFICRARQILENIQSDLMVNSGISESASESNTNLPPSNDISMSSSEVPMVSDDIASSEPRQPADGEDSTNTSGDPRPLGNNPHSLASIYRDIMNLHQDIQPTLERYEHLLLHTNSADTTTNDYLPDQVAEMMHCLAHAYHALSDVSYSVGGTNRDSLMFFPQLSAIRMPTTIRNANTQVQITPTSVPSSGASPTVGAGPASGWPTPGLAPIGQGRPSQSSTSSIQSNVSAPQVQFQVSSRPGQFVQGTPIAVAAISTVIRIPVGANAFTQTANSNTTTTTSSAHVDTSRENTSAQESGTSNGSGEINQQQGQTFQALFNPFSGIFPGQGAVRTGVGRPGSNAPATFTQQFSGTFQPSNQGSGNQDHGPLPLGLQNIMQNIMQSIPNIGQAPTSSNASNTLTTNVTNGAPNAGISVTSVTARQPPQRSVSLPNHQHQHQHSAPSHCHHHHHHHHHQSPQETDSSDTTDCDNPHHHHHHHRAANECSNPNHQHHHHHHPPPHHCDNPNHRHPAPNQHNHHHHHHHQSARSNQSNQNATPLQFGNIMNSSANHPDPLLPCQSYHFGPVFVQNRPTNQVVEVASIMLEHPQNQGAAGRNGQTNQNATPQNQTLATNNGGQVEDISQILNGIFGNISQANGQLNTSVSVPVAVNMRIETDDVSMDNDEDNDENEIDLDQIDVVQQVQNTFIGMLNRATAQTRGSPATQDNAATQNSNTVETTGSGQSQPATGTANANNQSLRNFLLQSTGIPDIQGDDLFSDFMVLLMDHLSLPDMISMFMGASTEPYQRLQVPTQQFVSRHFNSGAPIGQSDYETVAEKMSDGMSAINAETQPYLTVRADVDLDSTLRKLDRKHFLSFLRLLYGSSSEFATGLTEWYTEYTAWTFAVLDYAVTGGAEEYLRACLQSPVVQHALSSMDSSMNQLVISTLTQRIRSATSNHTITQGQVQAVLVKTGTRPRDTRTNPYKEKDDFGRAAKRTKRNEKVDLNEKWEQMCNVNGHASSESDSEQDGSPTSEDWHSNVPNDWVMVISRDAERQRQMPRQRPYSDAYINGVPLKRRALLTPHPESADMIDIASTLKKSAEKIGAKPKTSFEEVKSDIENLGIQKEFDAAFREDMEKRLHMDDDYRPNRHTNIDKYFMDRKRKSSQ